MENSLEQVLQFEGQEIKVITDKGVEMFNLANSCRVIGLIREKKNGTKIIRWDSLKDRLNTILSGTNKLEPICSGTNINEDGKNEIEYVLNKINLSNSEERKNIFISIELLLNLCLECKNDKARMFYSYLLDINKDIKFYPNCPERKEIKFLDKLEQALEPFNIKGEKQYPININHKHYGIDYYIPQLNIAVEYDEKGHSSYTYEEHEGRQKEIEKKLVCRFIRVTDKKSDEYNIGLVFKKLFMELIPLIGFGEVENYIKNIK